MPGPLVLAPLLGVLAPAAWAGPLLLEAGPEVPIDVERSENWGRIFPAADGWDFFFAAGGDYHHVPLADTLTPDLTRITDLTGRADLVDHAIAACPDGTWLHVASRSVNRPDDSATAFRYDVGFQRVGQQDLYEAEPLQQHRDMPVVCAEGFAATAFFEPDSFVGYRVVELGDDLAPVRVVEPGGVLIVTGSSLYAEGDTVGIVGFRGDDSDYLRAREFDRTTFELVDPHLQDVSPPGLRAYWSQGYARVGNYRVVAHMVRDDADGWSSQDGDVYLSVFNLDWRLVEQLRLTSNTPPDGGMQPWLAWKDDTLVVTYTRALATYAVTVRFDRAAAGLDAPPDDTAGDTSGDTPDDTSGPPDAPEDDAPPCGCRDSAAFLLLPLLGLRRRR